jgi:signal transduction histidine kinase
MAKTKEKAPNVRPVNSNDQIDYRELLLGLMHDLRRIGGLLQTNLYSAKIKVDKSSEVRALLETVQHTTDCLRGRLDAVDIEVNPERWVGQDPVPRSVKEEFSKAIRTLQERAKEKNIEFKLEANTDAAVDALSHFQILPFLILENAVKYSPKAHQINIKIWEDLSTKSILILVANYGPMLEPGEDVLIFKKGYRGANATRAVSNGEGRGLKLALAIAELHEGTLLISCGNEHEQFGGIPYAQLSAKIVLPMRRQTSHA